MLMLVPRYLRKVYAAELELLRQRAIRLAETGSAR
jgi:hypothetical protein